MKRLLSLFAFLLTTTAFAQTTVSIGSVAGLEATSSLASTTIDMSRPATANGQVNTLWIRWTGAGSCTPQVKIKVVRLDSIMGTFNVIADRGPFTVANGGNKLAVAPPIDVLAGDLVVTEPVNGPCGAVAAAHGRYGDLSLVTNGDFTSGRAVAAFTTNRDTRPLVQLTNTSDTLLAGVIPAAGATAGGFGSFFRTSMQLANPTSARAFVTVVYHPIGVPASGSDPSKAFILSPNTTSTHPDIVTEMGLSGLGSFDILTTNGVPPVVTSRVYNDNGPELGTSGFYEDMVQPGEAMHGGDAASFTLPGDPANFRVNAGVRTLSSGAQISVAYYEPSAGTQQGGTLFKSYAANYFEQRSIADFLGTLNIIPGGLIVVRVITGDAVVYFSVTDNRTNDTSATILKPPS